MHGDSLPASAAAKLHTEFQFSNPRSPYPRRCTDFSLRFRFLAEDYQTLLPAVTR